MLHEVVFHFPPPNLICVGLERALIIRWNTEKRAPGWPQRWQLNSICVGNNRPRLKGNSWLSFNYIYAYWLVVCHITWWIIWVVADFQRFSLKRNENSTLGKNLLFTLQNMHFFNPFHFVQFSLEFVRMRVESLNYNLIKTCGAIIGNTIP